MINPSRQNNQIILSEANPHPLVLAVPHIKVPLPVTDIADLLVLMQMLGEEHLHLALVGVAHGRRRHGHLVAVLVAALGGQRVDHVDRGAVAVEDADGGEVGFCDGAAGVVGFALVALFGS